MAEWVRVARVARAHGLEGEVALEMLGGGLDRLSEGGAVRVVGTRIRIDALRPAGGQVLCRLHGVADRDRARELVGEYLEVPLDEARLLPPDEYFHFQLVGLRVRDEKGREWGRVADVEEYPANDILMVETPGGQIPVPATREAVVGVDLEREELTVAHRFLEGWVDAV